jgi:hypothetical protein
LLEKVKNKEPIRFYYDGAFGANAQFFLKYDHIVLVCTGIGYYYYTIILE